MGAALSPAPVFLRRDPSCSSRQEHRLGQVPECHEDKAKGKNVHSAIAMGCTSCHEIRVNKDVTRVKLITTTPQALCLTCHADKNAADLKGTVHPPAVRDCLKCHDPHTSDNKYQLLKPTSGDKKAEPLPRPATPRAERPGKRQPPRRAGHGLRDLPRHPQDRRERQAGVRLPPDQALPGALHRLPRCQGCQPDQGAPGTSRSPPPIACSATIRTSRRSPS